MKTESIVASPFFRLPTQEFDDWLNDIESRFGEDDEFQNRDSVNIAVSSRIVGVQLHIRGLVAEVIESTINRDFSLRIALSDEGRKIQKVLLTKRLVDLDADEVLECDVPPGMDWTSPQGAILSLLICSDKRYSREAGLPFRVHSTIAARHIGINRSVTGDDFPINFLNEKQFLERKLHPRTMTIVELTEDDLECEKIEETNIRILIHEDLKSVVAMGTTNKKGRLAQQLIMESVTFQIAEVALENEYNEQSLGHRVRTKLERRLAVAKAGSSRQAIRSSAQGAFKLVDHLRKI